MATETQPTGGLIPEPQSQKPRFGTWRRILVLGLGIGAGIVIAIAGIGWGVWSYQNRTTPIHRWSPISLENIGIRVSLKTQARAGSLRYQFQVSPLTPSLLDAFDHISKEESNQKSFTVILSDRGGFERCRFPVGNFTRVVDNDGKAGALEENSVFLGCTISDYVESDTWNVAYQFPNVKTEDMLETLAKSAPNKPKAPEPVHAKMQNSEGEDTLTGASYDGILETESGNTFRVNREAEVSTTWTWSASEHIRYECKAQACLVRNLTNNQAVHATRVH